MDIFVKIKELVVKIKIIEIKRGKILEFLDINNMYPNILTDMAIQCMEKHCVSNYVPQNIVKACTKIANVSMNQNYFPTHRAILSTKLRT